MLSLTTMVPWFLLDFIEQWIAFKESTDSNWSFCSLPEILSKINKISTGETKILLKIT